MHVLGLRNDGRVVAAVLGETTDRQIALQPNSVCIFDFKEDFEQIRQKGISALKFAHPDKFGCRDSYSLLYMIIKANP